MVDLLDEGSWEYLLNSFKKITESYDKKCFKRKRVVNSSILVLMIVNMIQSKNKQGYSTIINDFWIKAATRIPELSSLSPLAKSSFSEARSKLDPDIFKELNRTLIKNSDRVYHLWHGHRVFAIDGSKINLPRKLLHEGFLLPNPQSYYPQGLMSCLYDLNGKVPVDLILSPSGNERICAHQHLNCLRAGNVVVYDRGYHSYGLLNHHIKTGIHTVMRMETTTTFNAVKQFVNSRSSDKIVTFSPAEGSIGKIRKSYPDIEIKPLNIRLVKYKVKNKLYVLATTLFDKKKYPKRVFSDLYFNRWRIEEMYKSFKSDIGMGDFHGQSTVKVLQELYAGMLLLTIARLFSNSTKMGSGRSAIFQSNYKSAIYLAGKYFDELFTLPLSMAKKLGSKLIFFLENIYHKIRPGRHFPRLSKKPRNKWINQRVVDPAKNRIRSRIRNRKRAQKRNS